ncbi:MAG: flippase-like domain-containing protein [Sphingobacteriales bacterium]|nr:flippase-like domain-containing protein [Sphingobacteriales bacterium]
MKKIRTQALNIGKFVLFLLLGLGIAYWSVKDIAPDKRAEMLASFKEVNYYWMFLSLFAVFLSNWSRSVRWQMLLEPVSHKPHLYNTFLSLLVAYFVNLAFPRLGEATRTSLVSRYEKISFEKVLGTTFTDRILDLLLLALLTALSVLLLFGKIGNFAKSFLWENVYSKFSWWQLVAVLAGFVIFFVALKILAARVHFVEKFKNFLHRMWEGIFSVRRIKQQGAFVFHSFFIWAMYYMMIYCALQSMESTQHLSLLETLSVLAFGTFGFIFTPGGIGAYPLLVASLMVLYQVPYEKGLAFGWIVWVMQSIFIIIAGIIALILLPLFNKKRLPATISS